ncbi:hypothetical protein HG535_0B05370 [Zygotorulaspora mrakii]|uniref:Protein kinase C-like 1 n=1 Tax=Zygotorulaspora mrakii TaxID=42260 RepID=A0A7H9AYK7_ZYGMR|nr:uncharacterized protein HG535_0B05370 [Zygotorulaspora mrakii]QLG71495.1 hypothetical protein HG535_0B05370 [Zygotorulaspora mrakii]
MFTQVEHEIHKKIERERNIIQGASNLKKRTSNNMVIQKCNTNIREARQNIQYLEETLEKLQLSSERELQTGSNDVNKKESYGVNGSGQVSTLRSSEHVFSRLDLVKYDCPSLSQRIQYLLQQLEFKLQVERQYQEANAKLTKLYQIDGDRQSSSAAEGGALESKTRIQLLTKALKKYQAINVDLDQYKPHNDDIMATQPKFRRKQLTGELSIGITAIRDVDHIQSPMFSRTPESYITIKIDDTVKARTRPSRNDRWHEEFQIQVGKGNEVEITVYDKVNDIMTPVAVMWLLLSDIAEEIRKKKVGKTSGQQGWVDASKVRSSHYVEPNTSVIAAPTMEDKASPYPNSAGGSSDDNSSSTDYSNSVTTNSWFVLEPAGQILLTLGFHKSSQPQKKSLVGGLHRHGAIINRQEEIYEQHGHHFVQKSFYNIMCCAYCGEFLRYTGFQCQDCKFLCHKKCYEKVVTKCIAKTTTDMGPDEAKLNHRIPHRFEPYSNRGTKWCCHCGYILPWGKNKVWKCSECSIMCHKECAHLVPDFCGMSMEMANKILRTIEDTKKIQEKKKRLPPISSVDSSATTAVSKVNPSVPSLTNTTLGDPSLHVQQATAKRGSFYEPSDNIDSSPYYDGDTTRPNTQADSHEKLHKYINENETYLNFTESAQKNVQSLESAEIGTLDPLAPGISQAAEEQIASKRNSVLYTRQDLENWKLHEKALHEQSRRRESKDQNNLEINRPETFLTKEEIEPVIQNPASLDVAQSLEGTQDFEKSHINPFRDMNTETFQLEQQNQMVSEAVSDGTLLTQTATTVSKESIQISPRKSQGAGKHRKKSPKRRKVSLDDFILLKVLGKGNFGKVLLSKSKNTGHLCAIKVLKKDHIIQNHDIESARAEKKVFLLATDAKHPFLTNLYCSFQTENRIYFAMEFIGGGDLMWHVQNQRLSVRRAKFYAAEVLLALKYFHSNGVIYRDLKLENILLTPQGHIKIADYGLCKDEMWYGSTTSTFCGTPEFMAPEILKDQAYTKAVDWWAFGVLLYQMLLCQSPFSGDDEDEVFNAILTDEPLYPIDMAGDIVQIFQGLLTKDPEKRLGAGPQDALDVMKEPFFRSINFDDLLNLRIQPPYIPDIKSPEDTSYFEQEFTVAAPTLTPLSSVLETSQQEEFRGFSFMPADLEL